MGKGVYNFSRVLIASITKPAKLIVMGTGITVGMLFPDTALWMIILSLFTVTAMSWADINDPEFIKTVLSKKSRYKEISNDLASLIKTLDSQHGIVTHTEVKEDILAAKETLLKINTVLSDLNADASFGQEQFVKDYIQKVIDKLIRLTVQEQRARNYLAKESVKELLEKIEILKTEEQKTTDTIAKKEYKKAIVLREEQLKVFQSVQERLERIDSYITRIKIVLENTYAHLTKLGLRDESHMIDDSDILVDSLQQIVSDIDRFEEKSIEIADKVQSGSIASLRPESTTRY